MKDLERAEGVASPSVHRPSWRSWSRGRGAWEGSRGMGGAGGMNGRMVVKMAYQWGIGIVRMKQ